MVLSWVVFSTCNLPCKTPRPRTSWTMMITSATVCTNESRSIGMCMAWWRPGIRGSDTYSWSHPPSSQPWHRVLRSCPRRTPSLTTRPRTIWTMQLESWRSSARPFRVTRQPATSTRRSSPFTCPPPRFETLPFKSSLTPTWICQPWTTWSWTLPRNASSMSPCGHGRNWGGKTRSGQPLFQPDHRHGRPKTPPHHQIPSRTRTPSPARLLK